MVGPSKRVEQKELVPITMSLISKTVKLEDGIVVKGLDVETHCKIVGLAALEILSALPKNLVEKHFPRGTELVAACHDVGKISPDFQIMIYKNVTGWSEVNFPELKSANSELAKRKEVSFHAKVSAACLEDKGKFVADIAGRHHGFKPNPNPRPQDSSTYGGSAWNNLRLELIQKLESYFFPTCHSSNSLWPLIENYTQANCIAGLVTVADWIGSGDLFSHYRFDTKLDDDVLRQLVKQAVRQAGFAPLQIISGLSFVDIFGFEPHPIQKSFMQSITGPGVYVLEAPMGIGKTEAALYAAYTMLEQKKAHGIYFALPTQLTSNKIQERVSAFLQKISASDKDYRSRLLHSAAWLYQLSDFGEDADIGGSWFDEGKRGILAPFAVGTIDQALMAVMNVNHGFVRTFGLMGKVVILDEVHSYDSYTGTIMNELVRALRMAGATVIILSATLANSQKKALLGLDEQVKLNDAYPLITSISAENSKVCQTTSTEGATKNIAVKTSRDEDAILQLVLQKAESGEQVLWIENTVAEAQAVYKKIAARIDSSHIECGLIHSRFLKKERSEHENKWVALYGKSGTSCRAEKGRILVGTQVLEQSIDIDADFLVTRLCPTDMLLQRIGRLWRHELNNQHRPKTAQASALILVPPSDKLNDWLPFGNSGLVYSPYVLFRTLEVWQELHSLTLPKDIRSLIEKTYSERLENGAIARMKTELENSKQHLKNLAALGLSTETNTQPESKAQTRYSEIETTSVLLLRSLIKDQNGDSKLVFLDGTSCLMPKHCLNKKAGREIASIIMQNTVQVAEKYAPATCGELQSFKDYVYIGSGDVAEKDQPFRVAIVGKDDEIRGLHGTNASEQYSLWYNSLYGYSSEKKGGLDG